MCVHACDFERCMFTKLLINQWSTKSHTSMPDGLHDLRQAQDLPEPPCHIYKTTMKLSVGTRLNALKSSLHLMAIQDLGFFFIVIKEPYILHIEADSGKQGSGPQLCWSEVLRRQEQQQVQFLQDVRAKGPSGAGEPRCRHSARASSFPRAADKVLTSGYVSSLVASPVPLPCSVPLLTHSPPCCFSNPPSTLWP